LFALQPTALAGRRYVEDDLIQSDPRDHVTGLLGQQPEIGLIGDQCGGHAPALQQLTHQMEADQRDQQRERSDQNRPR